MHPASIRQPELAEERVAGPDPEAILAAWREAGAASIAAGFPDFRTLVDRAHRYRDRGRNGASAALIEMASLYGLSVHSGLFASATLERLVSEIGRARVPGNRRCSRDAADPQHILHVATAVQPIGGMSRMIWRWIRQDSGRRHSVALTRQCQPVPVELCDAVRASGGRLYRINQAGGGLIGWARKLRRVAEDADLVVLHVGNRDVVPSLAFADPVGRPPTIYLNHADHLFWLGVGISDIVASLRESGLRLSMARRGVEPDRHALLPIILDTPSRTMTREQAKRRLGISENTIVLLSVARALKYRTLGGMTYADAHLPFLSDHPNAVLFVVGAGERSDWADAVLRTGGRIVMFAERPDTDVFYQAADIYVDSFPFVSTTSLLEAGCYEIPLVTRFPYSEASAILKPDVPGLAHSLICSRTLADYTADLSRLANDAALRAQLGARTRQDILALHTGGGWQSSAEALYARALAVPRDPRCTIAHDIPTYAEPDLYYARIHDHPLAVADVVRSQLGLLPFAIRLQEWLRFISRGGLTRQARRDLARCWVPDWMVARLRAQFATATNRLRTRVPQV